jgi:hypothetical protein
MVHSYPIKSGKAPQSTKTSPLGSEKQVVGTDSVTSITYLIGVLGIIATTLLLIL